MDRLRVAWFAAVIVLVIIVVGAIEAGKLSGVESLPIGGVKLGQSGTIGASTNGSRGGLGSQLGRIFTGNSSAVPLSVSSPQTLSLSEWPLYLLVAVTLAVGLALLMRSSSQTTVYDFSAALDELDKQRSTLEGSWSRKLRNAALLRYYSLMRSICERMGLPEAPSETPQEYLARVASAFKVDSSDAKGFATAFERARYGGELSDTEAKDVAVHMANFVVGLRGSVGLA